MPAGGEVGVIFKHHLRRQALDGQFPVPLGRLNSMASEPEVSFIEPGLEDGFWNRVIGSPSDENDRSVLRPVGKPALRDEECVVGIEKTHRGGIARVGRFAERKNVGFFWVGLKREWLPSESLDGPELGFRASRGA